MGKSERGKLHDGKLPKTGSIVQTGKKKLIKVDLGGGKTLTGCQYCIKDKKKVLKSCIVCGF